MLEEARRLCNIQKKRELAAAGIESEVKKKIKGEDYNTEVPFERVPLENIYKTGVEENPKPNLQVSNVSIQAFEGKRRDEEEERFRKLDQKRIQKLKESNLPKVIESMSNKFDNSTTRTKLILPSPHLTDKELEQMGKIHSTKNSLSDPDEASTKMLLRGEGRIESTITPKRTPRYLPSTNGINQHSTVISRSQTPLVKDLDIQIETVNDTHLGLFTDKDWEVSEKAGHMKSIGDKNLNIRKKLLTDLFNLPKPNNKYEIEVPELIEKIQEIHPEEGNNIEIKSKILNQGIEEYIIGPTFLKDLSQIAELELSNLPAEENELDDLILKVKELMSIKSDNKSNNLNLKTEIMCLKDATSGQDIAQSTIEKDLQKIEYLQKKLKLSLSRYPKKLNQINLNLNQLYQEHDKDTIDFNIYNTLYQKEKKISSSRINESKEFYEKLLKKEIELQKKHEQLIKERKDAFEEAPVICFI